MTDDPKEIMLDLLCEKAIYGLEAGEEKQLADLQQQLGVEDDSLSLEFTAAAIGMAGINKTEEMPSTLREKIVADAEVHFKASRPVTVRRPVVEESSTGGSWFGWLGWAFAAAACVALALNVYYRPEQVDIAQPLPTPTPEIRLTPAQMRERLIQSAPDIARGVWGAGNVKQVVPAGDIVWSDTEQAGFMRLSGLPVNDPNQSTYQLWIFDETQSDKTPIDGGTFNVTAEGEVIVPIDPKLAPRNTKMYAITVEKPGGVVVSDRSKIVALAKRET